MSQLKHIAAIPDGNRRYKQKHGLSLEAAYARGFRKAEEVLEWASEADINEMSLWALSLENFLKRSLIEKRIIFRLLKQEVEEALESKELQEKNVCVKFFGKLELLPQSLMRVLRELEEKTAHNAELKLNVAIAYSGRDEIVRAAQLLAQDLNNGLVTGVSEKTFAKYLYIQDSPDLIIRTGGVQRLSGFMPFQSAYSEYYFSKKLWPEFSKKDFEDALDFYHNAERRFGK